MEWIRKLKKELWIKRFLIISGILLLVELSLFFLYQYTWDKILRNLILSEFLLLLGFLDLDRRIVPNQILLVMLGIRMVLLLIQLLQSSEDWKEILISCLLGLIFPLVIFLLIRLLAKGGIGMGDIKLILILPTPKLALKLCFVRSTP